MLALPSRLHLRGLFECYFENVRGLVYVVDSADEERLEETTKELHLLLAEEKLQKIVVLILANKQDLANALSVDVLTEKLELEKIKQKWHILASSAIEDVGLREGWDWITNALQ